MNIAEWLHATARLRPNSPALLTGLSVTADYATFSRRAAAIGAALRNERGVAQGDRVAIYMTNCTQYLEVLYGIWWCGAVAVPVNAKLHAKEALWICDHADASIVFTCAELAASMHDAGAERQLQIIEVGTPSYQALLGITPIPVPAWRKDDDLAWLFYTSGTTGRPKGVMLSHGNLMAMSLCYLADVDQVTDRDATLYAAPMSHGAGLYNFIHVRMGAMHVVPKSGGFDADEVLDLGKSLRDVSMFAAPTMIKRLVDAGRRRGETGDGLRTIIYGGGPMYLADIQDAMSVFGARFVQIYGQGESPMTITALNRHWHGDNRHPRYIDRLASVGTAQSLVSVRVTNEKGLPVPIGETGEVEVKGAPVMLGYWKNEKATAESLKDGWLRTGDVGHLDHDGFLTLSDRSKDVIISGGSNIYPREVEEVLLSCSDVLEAAVIGVPDAEWGEIVVACIVTVPGASISDAELDAHCLSSIARFKRPKRYARLNELPKNNYGKILKTELRRLLAEANIEVTQ